ncbi:coiled-coil domain-containing protein [Sarocladium implicatum]|nr:coiled-coil domain-containing protein [Sarocladium implicatum]
MSKPLAFGLNFSKKPAAGKPAPPKRKPVFGGNDDSDDEGSASAGAKVEAFSGELDDITTTESPVTVTKKSMKNKNGPPTEPPKMKSKTQPNMMFGDLSSSLASKKNAEAAAELDASVYEYDGVYDSLKPKKHVTQEDKERKPKYMKSLLEAAEVRKRDALIAEEKKIAREREAEGDEYEGTEKFVTEAYKKQQEENKRIEEEERKREEEEAKKNKTGGMSAFYRNMLNKDEQRHAEVMKAAEDGATAEPAEDEEADENKVEAERVREMNDKGADIALNEDGQVVDKRQLLKGGLNVAPSTVKKAEAAKEEATRATAERQKNARSGVHVGNRQAQRERQSRMLAEQLEESLKRSRDEEAAERLEMERKNKSQKTEGEISSAKERYLARKRAAEAEKKKG